MRTLDGAGAKMTMTVPQQDSPAMQLRMQTDLPTLTDPRMQTGPHNQTDHLMPMTDLLMLTGPEHH